MRTPPLRRTLSLPDEGRKEADRSVRTSKEEDGEEEATSANSESSDHKAKTQERQARKTSGTRGAESTNPLKREDSRKDMDDDVFWGKEGRKAEVIQADKGKRPREDSDDDLQDLKKMFTKLKNVINDLTKEVHQNTRVEIKKGIKVAKGQADEIVRKWDALTFQLMERKKTKRAEEENDDTIAHTDERRIMEDKGTQTPREAWRTRNESSAAGIKKAMTEHRDFESFRKLEQTPWPTEVYTKTSIMEGNPIWETTETDLALCISLGERTDKGMARQFARKFPEVVEQLTEKNTDAFYMVSYVAKVDRGNGSSRIGRKTATVVSVDEDISKTFDNCVRWRDRLRESGIKRVAVVRTEAAVPEMRKLLEFVFWEEDIKVMLYELGVGKKEAKPNKSSRPPPKSTKATAKRAAAVVVSAARKSYSDMLRVVKGKVNIASAGINITTARKTRNGGLLLTVDGGAEKAKALEKEITGKCAGEGIVARGTGREEVLLHIKGIDPSIAEEEVMQAIRSRIGLPEAKVTIKSMRPAYGGNLNATITAEKEAAEKLLTQGALKIGWTTCKVVERVELRRCHRCWLVGHSAARCDGVDRRNLCLRCGRDSHKAKDCREGLFCPVCSAAGHRADSMGCPRYREEVRRMRERRSQNRQQLDGPNQEVKPVTEAEPSNMEIQTVDSGEGDEPPSLINPSVIIINDSSQ